MDARFIRAPFRRILVSRPRHHALGLLIVDVLISLHIARVSRAPLVFLRGEWGEDSPLLHLVAEDVTRLDNAVTGARMTSRAWTILMKAIRFKDGLLSPRHHLVNIGLRILDLLLTFLAASVLRLPELPRRYWNPTLHGVQTWLESLPFAKGTHLARINRRACLFLESWKLGKQDRQAASRERVLRVRTRLSARLEESRRSIPPARQIHHGQDLRRLCVEQPLQVGFARADEDRARGIAEDLGLVGKPLVTVHVRSGGSKRDSATGGFVRDMARDAAIESYLPAVDLLVGLGYTVVRIGDSGMDPVVRAGLVDAATHPRHSLLLDLWCVRNSRFFIACDSGPYMLSWLFGVPCLAVNVTNVLGVFPLRNSDLYLLKTVEETATGREIPLLEMLTTEFLSTLRRRIAKEGALRYVDNDSVDILSAVREMEEGLRDPQQETRLQRMYRCRIEEIRNGPLVRAKLSEKTGAGEVLMGEGRVVHAFAQRHFGPVADPGGA